MRQLSLGQRIRGDLVAAMLYEPCILYLDEPTIGLDVFAKERILKFITEINQVKHTTIILTTHDLSDVEKLCQRVVMIDQGHVIYDGSIVELKERYTNIHTVHLTLEKAGINVEILGTKVLHRKGTQIWLEYDSRSLTVATLLSSICSRYPVVNVSIKEVELEVVIREIYKKYAF